MWRTNANTIEGERARTASQLLLFDGFCKKETEAGRDVFFGEKYGDSITNGGAGGLPRRRSRSGTANSNGASALQLGAEGACQGDVSFDERPDSLDVGFFLPQEQSAQPRLRRRQRPGAPSEETGTMGQLYSFAASSPLPSCTSPGVTGAFSAPHQMWKAWCKQ